MQLEEKSIKQAYPNFKNKWGSLKYKNPVKCTIHTLKSYILYKN